MQAGCLSIAQCCLARTYPRILNSNCEVSSMSADVSAWLATQYLPHLGVAGVDYLAWVCAPDLLLKHFTGEAVRQLRTHNVAVFDDLADAYAWLQHTRFPAALTRALPDKAARKNQFARQFAALVKQVTRLPAGVGRGAAAWAISGPKWKLS